MQEYEYVGKKEYAPVKKELVEIIRRVRKIMVKEYDTSFDWQLIGSGRRNLVTRIKGGNKGYDFDYNLIIPTLETGWEYEPKIVAKQFMKAFRQAAKDTSYEFPKHRTSVIQLRKTDRKNKKVCYGCDFAIIYYKSEDYDDGYKYLKHWDDGHYTFEMRGQSRECKWKLDEILEYTDGWNRIREEYLKLKNRNRDRNKRSYVLYLESIHNVYNQIQQQEGMEAQCESNINHALYLGRPAALQPFRQGNNTDSRSIRLYSSLKPYVK